MNRRSLGLILRSVGPMIQILCLTALFAFPARLGRFRGAILAFFLVGFAFVLVGIVLSRGRPARPPRMDEEINLRL